MGNHLYLAPNYAGPTDLRMSFPVVIEFHEGVGPNGLLTGKSLPNWPLCAYPYFGTISTP